MTTLKSISSGISKVKDIIYIVAFAIAIGSFLVNEGKNRQKNDNLIQEVEEIKETLKDYRKALDEQLVLNGQIIQYMKLDQNN